MSSVQSQETSTNLATSATQNERLYGQVSLDGVQPYISSCFRIAGNTLHHTRGLHHTRPVYDFTASTRRMQISHKPRARHSRTRAGCLTCRSRKKKCDEVKPRCAGCRRNQLVCEWASGLSRNETASGPAVFDAQAVGCSMGILCTRTKTSSVQIFPALRTGTERACELTPQSTLLLQHYLMETISMFAMTPLKDNPFATILLPLGQTDDLLMHSLLAFSGAHLSHKAPANLQLATATKLHYSKLLGGLRKEFATLHEDDATKKDRLLRILLVTCHYEAIAGDTNGAMFNHLSASRQLILSLLAHRSRHNVYQASDAAALGFSVELYSYLVFSNTIVPHCGPDFYSSPIGSFIASLETIGAGPSFSALFGGSHELYRLIPEVSHLASQRLLEEKTGVTIPSLAQRRVYNELYMSVESWKLPPPPPGNDPKSWEQRQLVGDMFREGLFIYLATSLAGSFVNDPAVIVSIQDHIDKLFNYAPQLLSSESVAVMLWPFVIAATCMVKAKQQQTFLRVVKGFDMKHLVILSDVLEMLWDDPDPRAYGPYGLHLVLERTGLSIALV